jgi:hypothetical protein
MKPREFVNRSLHEMCLKMCVWGGRGTGDKIETCDLHIYEALVPVRMLPSSGRLHCASAWVRHTFHWRIAHCGNCCCSRVLSLFRKLNNSLNLCIEQSEALTSLSRRTLGSNPVCWWTLFRVCRCERRTHFLSVTLFATVTPGVPLLRNNATSVYISARMTKDATITSNQVFCISENSLLHTSSKSLLA